MAQILHLQRGDVAPVEAEHSRGGVDEGPRQVHQRGLARAIVADQRDLLPGGNVDRHAVEHRAAAGEGEADGVELGMAARPRHRGQGAIVVRRARPRHVAGPTVCAAIFVIGLAKFALRQPNPWLVLIAVPYLIIVVAMGYTRQAAAIGLVMWGLATFDRGRVRQFAVAVLAAVTFHFTAIAMLPLGITSVTRNNLVTC